MCDCLRSKEYLAPCHHILFVREQCGSPLCDIDTFNFRYKRDSNAQVELAAADKYAHKPSR